MLEQELAFESGDLTLRGTLTVPNDQGPFPGVLLVPGSGQVDRNENHRKLRVNAFQGFAARLAHAGSCTFRYDKRGVGASDGDFWSTGLWDNVSDAKAALACMASQDAVRSDCTFLLGHSEGALIAARLAGEGSEVAGMVLVSGSAQRGEDVLKWQAQQVVKGLPRFAKMIIRLLRIDPIRSQQKHIDRIKASNKDWFRVQLVAKVNAKWMREFLEYDPANDLPKIKVPVLAITGAKDIQVDPADLKSMKRLIPAEFESHELPGLSHILRTDPKDPPSISSYKKQVRLPVDERVLDIVSSWLINRT